jgi:hypothetical protein
VYYQRANVTAKALRMAIRVSVEKLYRKEAPKAQKSPWLLLMMMTAVKGSEAMMISN